MGHLTTFYWIGGQPGDVHMCIASPGWAKHAWSAFFAPWIAEATIFIYNYARFDAAALGLQTVKGYMSNAMRRLEATTRHEAVVRARSLGQLP